LVAPSNDAADILVEKLAPLFPPSEMCRVLAYSRGVDQVSSGARPYVIEGLAGNELGLRIMRAKVVVATVTQASKFPFLGIQRGHFGALFVDEAGHATEPEVVAVASCVMNFDNTADGPAGQIVLAGDPKQLGPVISSSVCLKFGMSESYMERLSKMTEVYGRMEENHEYPGELITKLVQNFRSHPAILKLPNEMFYDGDLVNRGDVLSTHSMAQWEYLPTRGFPVLFHSVHGENLREGNSPSWFNPQEAEEVVKYVELLVHHSKPKIQQKDIGVITPYARQAQKIRLALKSRSRLEDVKVGSVEAFQGQERRCIIVSTVRAQPDLIKSDLKYNLGFVANAKRFNVAVTRAKALLIVIGNPEVLAMDKQNWLPFLDYCRVNGAWAGQPWDIEDDSDHEQLEPRLESKSDEDWDVVEGPSAAAFEHGPVSFINREE
jgi:helicase MOV-10